mmetsp:Transcript_22716/g.63397  ORF Transcript_22716/g.63397 Transcript_22716/m.63397 type:complete len:285 (+) Transcript_22716:488-1342(+)
MLLLVIPHVDKDIVEAFQLGTAGREISILVGLLDGAEQIEEERIVVDVVLLRDLRHGTRLEHLLVLHEVLAVGVEGVILDELRQMIRGVLGPRVDEHDVPVVEEGHGLGQHAIDGAAVAAQRFHDEEMVQLVVGLGVVRAHLVAQIAFAERLAQMQDGEVGEVGHAGDGFEHVEACEIAIRAAHGVDEADELVDGVDDDLVEGVDAVVHLVGDLAGGVGDGRGGLVDDVGDGRGGRFLGRWVDGVQCRWQSMAADGADGMGRDRGSDLEGGGRRRQQEQREAGG